MRVSERLLQASGITVVPVDLSEIIFAAQRMGDDDKQVKDKVAEIRAYGKIPDSIPNQNIVRNAKLSVVIYNWVRQNNLDAFSVQCWSSIQLNYGCATCTVMSMMSNKLLPRACEGDICGTVAMHALALASETPSALLDWNNNYGDAADKGSYRRRWTPSWAAMRSSGATRATASPSTSSATSSSFSNRTQDFPMSSFLPVLAHASRNHASCSLPA